MATTPICRCRVLYLGSAVPHITKDGLQGIQEPLRDLYPEHGPFTAHGIDSWLSVWSNGILLENVDESRRELSRFFDISTLHYCAAVRYVLVSENDGGKVEKFLPLDSPFARHANLNHPPLFACILRRTEGIKVLECHAFICKKEAAANALVRSCFHGYADSVYARQIEENPYLLDRPSLNTMDKVAAWKHKNGRTDPLANENYKIWSGRPQTERDLVYVDSTGTIRSIKSVRSLSSKSRQMFSPPKPPSTPSMISNKSSKGSKRFLKGKSKKHEQVNGYRTMHPVPINNIYAGSGLYTERIVKRPDRPPLSSIEEPAYIPSTTRPMSPTASYQPSVFPHEQYFRNGTSAREKKEEENESKELESLFNTGIYRKKGHLNERAFSFSIRQEHRSRSNSLANLHFFPNSDRESVGGDQRIEDRKERELAQLVSDLNLKDQNNGSSDNNFIRKKPPAFQR